MRTIFDDPTSQSSEEQMADMIAQAGVSLDEMRAQLKKAIEVMRGETGTCYTYDAQVGDQNRSASGIPR